MKSYDVKFWAIRPGKAKTKRTYEVRWKVGAGPAFPVARPIRRKRTTSCPSCARRHARVRLSTPKPACPTR